MVQLFVAVIQQLRHSESANLRQDYPASIATQVHATLCCVFMLRQSDQHRQRSWGALVS